MVNFSKKQDSLIFLSGLVVFILLVSLIPIFNRPQSTHATDVSNDKPITFIPLKDNRDGLCTYNIVQVIGGVTRTIQALNCSTGNADSSSTNASLVFNYVMTQISKNQGGVVHVTGYNTTHPYNITAPIIIPDNGHLYFLGDGMEYTVLKVPSGSDNNLFQLTGTKTKDSFFNTFAYFEGIGNPSGTNNRGFVFNGTGGFGVSDSLIDNVFLRDFKQDDVYLNNNCWNNRLENSVLEHAGNAGLYVTGGLSCQDFKTIGSKFLYNGKFGVYNDGYYGTYVDGWYYKTNQTAFKNNGGVSIIVTNNRFLDNGIQTTNTYYDIWNLGNQNVFNSNKFSGSDSGVNQPKYGFFEDTFTNGNSINGNVFRTGGVFGTAPLFVGTTSQSLNYIQANTGYNPKGVVASPFFTTGSTIIPNSGNSATPTNATDYLVANSPIIIDSTGGVGVSIILKDNSGNTITSGLVTLSNLYVPVGDKIRFTFAVAPTVTVAFQ